MMPSTLDSAFFIRMFNKKITNESFLPRSIVPARTNHDWWDENIIIDSSVLLTVRSSNDVNSCENKKFNVKHTLHASFTRAFILRKDRTRWSAKLPPLSRQVLYRQVSFALERFLKERFLTFFHHKLPKKTVAVSRKKSYNRTWP